MCVHVYVHVTYFFHEQVPVTVPMSSTWRGLDCQKTTGEVTEVCGVCVSNTTLVGL